MGASGCSGQVPQSCSDHVAGWGGAADELGFPAVPGCVIPGLPSTSRCCAAFPSRSRGVAEQDPMVRLQGAVGEQCSQGDVAPFDTWNIHGAECNPEGDDAHRDDWGIPDEVGSMESGADGVKLATSPTYESPLSANKGDREGDSDDRSEAAIVEAPLPRTTSAEAALVTDETAQVSTVVPGTDLDSQESLTMLPTSARGSPCSTSDKEQLPALLILGPYGHSASQSEAADKVSFASDAASRVTIVDSAAASDTTKPGSPALLDGSSIDVALQQDGQVGKSSESLNEPSAVTIPLEEPDGCGSPQQWPAIDRESLHHISNMNLRPPRSRRTRQPSGRASIKNTVNVPRGASGSVHPRGATCSSGGRNGGVLPTLAAGAMGKPVEELLLW